MKSLFAVVAVLAAGVVQAQAADTSAAPGLTSGAYFGLAGGVHFIWGGDATAVNRTPSNITFNFHPGMAIAISGGYKWTGGFRAELEGSYRRNGVKDYIAPQFTLTGHQNDVSMMANVLYDIPTQSRLSPYIGVGIGASRVTWSDFRNAINVQITHEPGGTRLAFQGIVGLAYAASPGLDFTLDARYKGSNGHEFTGYAAADYITSFHNRGATFMAGLRYGM